MKLVVGFTAILKGRAVMYDSLGFVWSHIVYTIESTYALDF